MGCLKSKSPDPQPDPTPVPEPSSIIGYYSWNWAGSTGQKLANIGIAFTGYVTVADAISLYNTETAP